MGIMVEFSIKLCMKHHFCMHNQRARWGDKEKEQALSEALERAFWLDWKDDKLLKKNAEKIC